MNDPEHGELLSECCDAPAYLDVEWDTHSSTWQGMCQQCREHMPFYDSSKEEEPIASREFSPTQLAIIERIKTESQEEQ